MRKLWPVLFLLAAQACDSGTSVRATDAAQARQNMVEAQIAERGIKDGRVLEAMRTVPRHEFVPADVKAKAYEDTPLPIGYEQTISQPYIVALMTQQLAPAPTDRVLEIGTGSGYQAAVLSTMVREVCTIEIVEPLAKRAKEDLARLGYKNVEVRHGDGYLGWKEKAPFDSIIVTCAPDRVPKPLIEQLKEGGRMIIPVGEAGNQQLFVMEKRNGKIGQRAIVPVAFVPMTGEIREQRPQD
ncbi:MAG: protein-L-isoaspartate(D-aspartate) O-methyltransferase [Chthoniobacteraceae bacterium]